MTIAEKIKALLAKAASTDNEHEAALFLAKAHELMEKHQLGAEDLSRDDPMGEDATYERADRGGVDWDFSLMFAVARYYGCRAIRWHGEVKGVRKYWMRLVGRESARVTTIEMHKYLVSTVRRLGREAARDCKFKKYVKDGDRLYWTGDYLNADQCARQIGNALGERLDALAPTKPKADTPSGANALVTLDEIGQWVAKYMPELADIKGRKLTTNSAREIAASIGLSEQVRASGIGLIGSK